MHLRKSDASLFRARSGSFEPAVAFAGRQGPQHDQQEGRSAPDVWMFPDFLASVASRASATRIHKSEGSPSSTKRQMLGPATGPGPTRPPAYAHSSITEIPS